jgi:hypothetical protein
MSTSTTDPMDLPLCVHSTDFNAAFWWEDDMLMCAPFTVTGSVDFARGSMVEFDDLDMADAFIIEEIKKQLLEVA